jgi:hypothetical protein
MIRDPANRQTTHDNRGYLTPDKESTDLCRRISKWALPSFPSSETVHSSLKSPLSGTPSDEKLLRLPTLPPSSSLSGTPLSDSKTDHSSLKSPPLSKRSPSTEEELTLFKRLQHSHPSPLSKTPPSDSKTSLSSPSDKTPSKELNLSERIRKNCSLPFFSNRVTDLSSLTNPPQKRSLSTLPYEHLKKGVPSSLSLRSHSCDPIDPRDQEEGFIDSSSPSKQSYRKIHLSPLDQQTNSRPNSSTKSLKPRIHSLPLIESDSFSIADKTASFTPAFEFRTDPPDEIEGIEDYESLIQDTTTPLKIDSSSQFSTPPREERHSTIKKPTPKYTRVSTPPPGDIMNDEDLMGNPQTPPQKDSSSQFSTPPSRGVSRQQNISFSHNSPFRSSKIEISHINQKEQTSEKAQTPSREAIKPKFSSPFLNKIWDHLPKTLEDLLSTAKSTAALAAYGIAAANDPNAGGEFAGDAWEFVEGALDTKESIKKKEYKKSLGNGLLTAFNGLNLGMAIASLAQKGVPQIAEAVGGIGALSTSTLFLAPLEVREQIGNREYGKAGGTVISTVGETISSLSEDIIPLVANVTLPAALVAAGPATATLGAGILTIFRGLETRQDELFHTECLKAMQQEGEGIQNFLRKYIRLSDEERKDMTNTQVMEAIYKKRQFFTKRTNEDLLTECLKLLNNPTKHYSQEEWIDIASKIEAQSFENLIKGWIETSLAAMTTTAAALAVPSNGITALVAGGIVLAYVIADGENGYIVKKVTSHCRPYSEMGKNGKNILMHMPIEKHVNGTPQRVGALRVIETDENGEPRLNENGDVILTDVHTTRKKPPGPFGNSFKAFPKSVNPSAISSFLDPNKRESEQKISIFEQQNGALPPQIPSTRKENPFGSYSHKSPSFSISLLEQSEGDSKKGVSIFEQQNGALPPQILSKHIGNAY